MAKVGVRIEGSETLSPAANSAAKSLRQIREETKAFSESAKNLAQPLINMRQAIIGVGSATGIIQLFRGVSNEIRESLKLYAEHDTQFASTLDATKRHIKDLKTAIGSVLAPVIGGLASAFNSVADAISRASENAKAAAKAISDQMNGAYFGEQLKAKQGADYALNFLPKDVSANMQAGLQNISDFLAGTGLATTLDKARLIWQAIYDLVVKYKLELTSVNGQLEAWRSLLWPQFAQAQKPFAFGQPFSAIGMPGQPTSGAVESLAAPIGDAVVTSIIKGLRGSDWEQLWGDAGQYVVQGISGHVEPTFESLLRFGSGAAPSPGTGPKADPFAGLGQSVLDATLAMGGFAGNVVKAGLEQGKLGLLMQVLNPIISGVMDVLAPVANQVLAPLVGIFVILGQYLGEILKPIFEALSPVIVAIANGFVWLYNNVLMPVGNAIIGVVQGIARAIKVALGIELGDTTSSIRDSAGQHAAPGSVKGGNSAGGVLQPLAPIDIGTLTGAGTGYINDNGGVGGGTTYTGGSSNTTVQQMPDITVNLTIEGNVIGAGGAKNVGEYMARCLEAYAGIGGRISIEGAID